MTTLNGLPTLIDGPGMYRTRNGTLVQIHEVRRAVGPNIIEFRAKGCRMRVMRSGKLKPVGYNIWHVSGRLYPLTENDALDIVEKVSDEL